MAKGPFLNCFEPLYHFQGEKRRRCFSLELQKTRYNFGPTISEILVEILKVGTFPPFFWLCVWVGVGNRFCRQTRLFYKMNDPRTSSRCLGEHG